MSDSQTLSVLTPDDTRSFRQMLAIYRDAIELSEQKPADEVAQLVTDQRYTILVSSGDGGTSGFAIAFFPAGQSFWLLEYMAVRRDVRSQGIGRQLFCAALAAAANRRPGAPCVLEVDQPAVRGRPGNDPVRRLRFYRKLGCRGIDGLDYILPLESAGRPPPMSLLVHGLQGQSTIGKHTLGEWLRAIYVQVYRRRVDDPRITAMMSAVTHGDVLRLI